METKFTAGQYAVSECKVEVKTGEEEYSSIADLEEISGKRTVGDKGNDILMDFDIILENLPRLILKLHFQMNQH